MKRLLALLLCFVMCLALIPAAAAEEIEIVRSDELEEQGIISLVETEESLAAPGVELTASAPAITTQPASQTAYADTTVHFTVKADGATSYQWQYRTSASGSWNKSKLSGCTTATLSVTATGARNGYQYRCKITNSAGTVNTNAATLYTMPGQCGDKLFWTLDSAGKLSITGSGKMFDFKWDSLAPWTEADQTVKTAVIGNSVTRIGDCAFESHETLTSVTIGTGVTAIGDYAFEYCSALTSLKLPASVSTLGDTPFDYCTSLKSFTVDSGNTKYSSADGVLFNKAQTSMLRFPAGKTGSYTVPSTVKTIVDSAFFTAGKLSAVTIPEGVTALENYAFYGCTALTNVTIPNSAQSIGEYAFCYCDHLKKVTIGMGVTSIGAGTFVECEVLADVYYKGSKTQWNKITIEDDNDPLLSAAIHYNA